MGCQLRMSAEFHDWLADLRASDPPAAVLAAEALAALAAEGDHLGPPLVVAVPARLEPEELLPALDQRYQNLLDAQQVLRRQVADAARAGTGERLVEISRQKQDQADAFRTRKETLKALYNAARAEEFIEQAQAEDASPDALTAVTARLEEIAGQIEREVGWEAPADGLLELRPGQPAGRRLRTLFAFEPPGTALLIAVLEGADAVRDHYREAVALASGVLRAARAGQAPETAEHTFADDRSFLAQFFPARADELLAGAAALVAANQARTLAEQRVRLGLTQAQVAARMGVRQERVSAIERAEPGATEVRTLAAYVEALGGRLDITAAFGPDRVPLR